MPPAFTAALGSVSGGLALLSEFTHNTCSQIALVSSSFNKRPSTLLKVSVSSNNGGATTSTDDVVQQLASATKDNINSDRGSADWDAAKNYLEKGLIYEGRVVSHNIGGLLIRFNSITGFLPFPQLGPQYKCKEPWKSNSKIARDLIGSTISVKVIQMIYGKKLVFSQKAANWSKYSPQLIAGDIYEGVVGAVEDFGAFVHLRFSDGGYYLTGLVHISEVSWDLVQDVRDILKEGDVVRVKVLSIDREKSKFTLSTKQLEEDPLLETLDKVISQTGPLDPSIINGSEDFAIEPLPGLETIIQELLYEDGITTAKVIRQGFEKRVVSQDLQLWLSNGPPIGNQYTFLARAGRQVQEIQLTTSLDHDGIKRAVQRVLERVP